MTSEKIGERNKGDIVRIKGFSDKRELIDGYNGYWLKIDIKRNLEGCYRDNDGYFGWIFSKYVNIDSKIDVSSFKIVKFNPDTEDEATIKLKINRNKKKFITKIYLSRFREQDFYTFIWSNDILAFVFNAPVGIFKYFPNTGEIEHVTYIGSTCEYAYCLITDDNKYMIQDYGTPPGPRKIAIYEILSNKEIFSGLYYQNIEYDGKSIVFAESCN